MAKATRQFLRSGPTSSDQAPKTKPVTAAGRGGKSRGVVGFRGSAGVLRFATPFGVRGVLLTVLGWAIA